MTSMKSSAKKVQLSLVISEENEPKHRCGVSSLQLDPLLDRLYSGGRDSIIRVFEHHKYLFGMEHHTDWVNDIILCCGGRHLISGSSDTTVKVWNAQKGFCMSTLRTHKDYVKVLAYAKDREQVASAGLDKSIYLWDINTLTTLTASNNTITTSSLPGSKQSIYSLTMNPAGTVIVSGSTERILRIWDPRTCTKLFKLRVNADNVKALVISRDGTHCISGSSDGIIRVWSLGMQRCIHTISVHTDSVWALLANDSFTYVISGGRDKRVVMTDLKDPNNNVLVCVEEAPILKMCFTHDQQAVWVSTVNSDIRCWRLPNEKTFTEHANNNKVQAAPLAIIPGAPAIRQTAILNDKRHILTKDSKNNVALYDVLRAQKVEDLGQVNFQDEITKRFQQIYIPNWFTIDLKTGILTINLGQDEVDCFAACVTAKDAGIKNYTEADQRVNYGKLLLQAIFEHWKVVQTDGTEAKQYISLPKHIPIIISEVDGRTLYRVLVGDAGGENETVLLNETVPNWVVSNIEENATSKPLKVQFYLLPHHSIPAHLLKQDRIKKNEKLVASDFVQCKKIAEHIVEKLFGDGNAGSPAGEEGDSSVHSSNGYNVDQIVLTCNDQVLEPTMDLRTVKHFMWKSSADFTLHYKIIGAK